MIGLPPTTRVFVATAPVDLRKSYDGLSRVAREALGQDPTSGHLLVFANRRRDRIKILYWDRDGFALWMKRLERATFRWPDSTAAGLEWTPAEPAAMLGGIDLKATRRRPRYALTST